MKLHINAPQLDVSASTSLALWVHVAYSDVLTLVTVNGNDHCHAWFELDDDEIEDIDLITELFTFTAEMLELAQ